MGAICLEHGSRTRVKDSTWYSCGAKGGRFRLRGGRLQSSKINRGRRQREGECEYGQINSGLEESQKSTPTPVNDRAHGPGMA